MNDTRMEQFGQILGLLFDSANKLQIIGDRYFEPSGLTSKQWYFCVLLEQFGDRSPSLGQMAEQMGSSYQNVKQIALKLEKKGLISIDKNPRDARELSLSIPESGHRFWDERNQEDHAYVSHFFQDLSEEEISTIHQSIKKLHSVLVKKI